MNLGTLAIESIFVVSFWRDFGFEWNCKNNTCITKIVFNKNCF